MREDNLSQAELATRVGFHESTVSKYLTGVNTPSAKFLQQAEDRLGWSMRWIRAGQGEARLKRIHNETVTTNQSGRDNQANVNYKGTQTISQDEEIARLRQELQECRMSALQREKELLQEINSLLRGKR